MKTVLLQFDTRSDNDAINKMIKINERYAHLHNYDFIYDNFKIDNIKYNWENLCLNKKNIFLLRLYYHRYELFEKYFNDYDYLVSIDSDACVSNPFINIEDLIDDHNQIFVCQDGNLFATSIWLIEIGNFIVNYINDNKDYIRDPLNTLNVCLPKFNNINILSALNCISSNPAGINGGFIILKKSNLTKDFINDFKKFYILFENANFCQGCIAALLQREKYKKYLKLLPLTTQGNPFYNHPDFIYNEDKTFLCHFAGTNNDMNKMLKHIDFIKNNKWWKKINE